MKIDTDYIEKLAGIINERGLSEISLEDGEQAITIRKEVVVASAPATSAANVAQVSVPVATASEVVASETRKSGIPITSPMVGTFYTAPSPDAGSFVNIGQSVKQGDVVCIIEAMKMMNEIKSEVTGKIVEICVEDGQPVEFGQVLMYVE